MNPQVQLLESAAEGLVFISESDYPFEPVAIGNDEPLENALLRLANKEVGTAIETVPLDYFFRNTVKAYPEATPEQMGTANRYVQLVQTLKETLTDIKVYRIGRVQVDAFIIGKLPDGTYGGLRTKLIET